MTLVGFPIPNTWFKHIYRYLCWFWVLSIHLAINVHMWLNLESVSSSYSPNASSSALSFNYCVDAINFCISTISVHTLFLIKTRTSSWKALIDSFELSISPRLYVKCWRALDMIDGEYCYDMCRHYGNFNANETLKKIAHNLSYFD